MGQTRRLTAYFLGVALFALPARALAVLPLSLGGVAFGGALGGSGCGEAFFAIGTAPCSAPISYTGGPLGGGVHVTGTATGTGVTTAGAFGANPTATASLTVSGGDTFSGAGVSSVTTQLQYYVTVIPLTGLAATGLKIPLAYSDAGSIDGTVSSTDRIGGSARTRLHAFDGNLVIDGSHSSLDDEVDDIVDGKSLNESYGGNHSVVFDFSEGDTIAEVDLVASCVFGSDSVGFGTGTCHASADPFLGFDQAAFDAKMGAKTFNLADFFKIVVSPGLEPGPSGVPEPGAWAMLILGFVAAGAVLRQRSAFASN